MRQIGLFGKAVITPQVKRKATSDLSAGTAPECPAAAAKPSEAEAEVNALIKEEGQREKKRLRAQQRREAGLRYEVVQEHSWLVCSHT